MSRMIQLVVERSPVSSGSAAETAVRLARRVVDAAPETGSSIGAIVLCHATVDESVLESGSTAVRLQHELQLKSCFPFSIGQQPATGVFHAIDVALGLMAAERLGAVLIVCVDQWSEGQETAAPSLGPLCDDAAALLLSCHGTDSAEICGCGNAPSTFDASAGADVVASGLIGLVAPTLAARGLGWADVGHVVTAAPPGDFTHAVCAALPLVRPTVHTGPGMGSAAALVALADRLAAAPTGLGRPLTLLWALGPQGQLGALLLLPHGTTSGL